jgi:hypothetical protein
MAVVFNPNQQLTRNDLNIFIRDTDNIMFDPHFIKYTIEDLEGDTLGTFQVLDPEKESKRTPLEGKTNFIKAKDKKYWLNNPNKCVSRIMNKNPEYLSLKNGNHRNHGLIYKNKIIKYLNKLEIIF